MKELSEKETSRLRDLHWKALEAQGALLEALSFIAKAHGCDLAKERWNVSPDMKRLVKQ